MNYYPPCTGRTTGDEPSWLREVKAGVDVRFIRSDRLVPRSYRHKRLRRDVRSEPTPTVTTYSEELADAIGATLRMYGEVSQTLDRTFPLRLVNQSDAPDLTTEEIKRRLNDFEARRRRLTADC